MTMFLAPYTAIADIDGSPLDAGFLFFGEYGKDPELFPVDVFWDSEFTVPAAQPIRTRNGYPVRNGSPTKVYLKTAQHSIAIKNRNSAFILVDFKNKGWDASFVVDGDKTQKQINDNQARLNFSTIDNLANSTISNGGVGTLWAAGAAIFQELAPSATNQSLTTASGVKLAYITPYLKTQVDGDAKTVLDIAHYSRQGSSPVTSPNAVSIHDYTDAPRSVQIDKVGGSATDYVLGLRRANNATRRPDKTSEYIGGAGFLRCSYDRFTDGVKSEVLAFYIGPNANFGWSSDPASFVTAKPSNGTYAFTYSATVEEQYIASFGSASGQVLNIQDAISGTRTDIIAPANQTSGIRIEATGGGIDIAPKSGSPITVRGNINSTNGTDLTITAVGSTLNINATNGIKSLAPHRFSLHNVGTLPNAANFPNHMILVTNGDAGQPCLAVSNGTSWLRIPLGAAVSAT